ncbi:MAG: hypothetical protein AB9866_06970 [Syntrophobacteraceae bacterium]
MSTKITCILSPVGGASAPPTGLKPWLKLLAGFVLIWACIFGFGSLSRFLPGAKHMAEVIDERGLRATAIYYTDFEEPYEGSEYIRHSLESMPERK